MNNLRSSIDVLFRQVPISRLLSEQTNIRRKHWVSESIWNFSETKHLLNQNLVTYSSNDVENVIQRTSERWSKLSERAQKSVFNLLFNFTDEVLRLRGNEPVVEYAHLLRWRELSHKLGEDLFTCSFLAARDKTSSHQRTYFAWSPILSTNNLRLRNLLDQGVAENHFHLWGSAPHCDISWLALMNKVTERKKQFKKFLGKGKLNPYTEFMEEQTEDSLYVLCMKAAYIRLYLFLCITGLVKEKMEDNQLLTVEQEKHKNDPGLFAPHRIESFLFDKNLSEKQLFTQLNELQASINANRILFGKELMLGKTFNRPDYWLSKNIDNENLNGNELLCGERIFLYTCFTRIYTDHDEFKPLQDLFYTYLVIKSKFREEMVQVNDRVGFDNFSSYQDRKDVFLKGRDIYQRYVSKMAIETSMKNQKIRSFEARITPKSTIEGLKETIESIDKNALFANKDSIDRYLSKQESGRKHQFFYVQHFIKEKDKISYTKEKDQLLSWRRCRHAQLRKTIEKQAKAIAGLREGISDINNRIVGIDAASSEFNARPEVFSQAFRFLKNFRNKGRFDLLKDFELNELKATFHAGEDFYDIVDGLRTIDEAIKFLNLGEGDRIGHALALGVTPKDYYQSKGNTLSLPRQWQLDNICWLISRISKYNLFQFSQYRDYLGWQFQNLYHEIYDSFEKDNKNKVAITPELYYEAWKLRGDDPFLYNQEGKFSEAQHITFWSKSGVNWRYPVEGAKRKLSIVNGLYYYYHFNPEVKEKGNEIVEFKVLPDYIKVVEEVQKCFQKEIAQKHLGIETNPSSNCLIGTFRRYDKHPIINFYNLGLETDPEKIKNCPQLFVSINTDDQGVFNTYLENEYALMALALEKMKDENGKPLYHSAMIYDWLDRIRRMGLEMSFKKE